MAWKYLYCKAKEISLFLLFYLIGRLEENVYGFIDVTGNTDFKLLNMIFILGFLDFIRF